MSRRDLNKEYSEILKTKIALRDVIRRKGVDVPDDAPLGGTESEDENVADYATYISEIDNGSRDGGDYTVYFSWIDAKTGDPMYERHYVFNGQYMNLPKRFNQGGVAYNETHNPALSFIGISGDLEQLRTGIHENLVIQAEYAVTDESFNMRFHPTDSLHVPIFSCQLMFSDYTYNGVFTYTIDIDGIRTIERTQFISGGSYLLITEELTELVVDTDHLLKLSFIPSKPDQFGIKKFILGGNTYTYSIDSNSLYRGHQDLNADVEDPYYASQIQAIYMPYFSKTTGKITYDFPVRSTNNLTSMTTFVLPSILPKDDMTFEAFFCRKSSSLVYLSQINNTQAGNILEDGCDFENTGLRFLTIKKYTEIHQKFCLNASKLEVIYSEVFDVSKFDPHYYLNQCYSLKALPKFLIGEYSKSSDGFLYEGFLEGCNIVDDTSTLTGSQLVTKISNWFNGCESIVSIKMDDFTNLTSLGDEFCSQCRSLSSINLTNLQNLTDIGNDAFLNCDGLQEIPKLPQSVVNIGDNFAHSCVNATYLWDFPQGIKTIGMGFLNRCKSIVEIPMLPSSILSIGDNFLYECKSLRVVHLGNVSASIIPELSFQGCNSLERIYVSSDQIQAYINKFPLIPPQIFSDYNNYLHTIQFVYLTEKLYKEHDDGIGLDITRIPRTVYHGSTFKVDDSLLSTMRSSFVATKLHPKINFEKFSGDLDQLDNGVYQDLVIQAEYSFETPMTNSTDPEDKKLATFFTIDNSKGSDFHYYYFWSQKQVGENLSNNSARSFTRTYMSKVDLQSKYMSRDFRDIRWGMSTWFMGSGDGYVAKFDTNDITWTQIRNSPVILGFRASSVTRDDEFWLGGADGSQGQDEGNSMFYKYYSTSADILGSILSVFLGSNCTKLLEKSMSNLAPKYKSRIPFIFLNNSKKLNIIGENFSFSSFEYIPELIFSLDEDAQNKFECHEFMSYNRNLRYLPHMANIDNLGDNFCAMGTGIAIGSGLMEVMSPLTNIHHIGSNFCNSQTTLKNMTSLTEGLLTIGTYFMANCINLKIVGVIPSTVNFIGDYFLYNCRKLISVYLNYTPSSVMPVTAFQKCESLLEIFVPSEDEVSQYRAKFPDLNPNIFKPKEDSVYVKPI